MKTSVFDESTDKFLPENVIEELITRDIIEQVLGSKESPGLVDWIHEHSKKLFAIVILCGVDGSDLLQSMQVFREHQYTDEKLPLEDFTKRYNYFAKSVWGSYIKRYTFFNLQWEFLAPVFGLQYKYELHANSVLPFTYKDRASKQGSFGTVYRVEIEDAHRKGGIPSSVRKTIISH